MFRFAHPDFLYLLFILPVLIAFYVYAIILKKKAIKKYGNPELLAELMPEVSPKRQHLKFWLLFGAITMVIFVIAGPQFGSKLETVKRQGVEIMVCWTSPTPCWPKTYHPTVWIKLNRCCRN